MIRTKLPARIKPEKFYKLTEFFLEQDKPSELIVFYHMYCYLTLKQNTMQPEINSTKLARLLQWDRRRVNTVWKRLVDLNVIQGGGGKCPLSGLYDSVIYNITSSSSKGSFLPETLSYWGKCPQRICPTMFDKFWSIYPRKTDKGKALSKWLQICNRKDAPTWEEIEKAISDQKKSERWQDPQFIPMPTTWLNQRRWLDDPSEMKKIQFSQQDSNPAYVIDNGIRYNRCPDGQYRTKGGTLYIP